jgi:hypothetical protein
VFAVTVDDLGATPHQIAQSAGDDEHKLIAEFGAVPPPLPDGMDWSIRLN